MCAKCSRPAAAALTHTERSSNPSEDPSEQSIRSGPESSVCVSITSVLPGCSKIRAKSVSDFLSAQWDRPELVSCESERCAPPTRLSLLRVCTAAGTRSELHWLSCMSTCVNRGSSRAERTAGRAVRRACAPRSRRAWAPGRELTAVNHYSSAWVQAREGLRKNALSACTQTTVPRRPLRRSRASQERGAAGGSIPRAEYDKHERRIASDM